jgi:hypothetical protein
LHTPAGDRISFVTGPRPYTDLSDLESALDPVGDERRSP